MVVCGIGDSKPACSEQGQTCSWAALLLGGKVQLPQNTILTRASLDVCPDIASFCITFQPKGAHSCEICLVPCTAAAKSQMPLPCLHEGQNFRQRSLFCPIATPHYYSRPVREVRSGLVGGEAVAQAPKPWKTGYEHDFSLGIALAQLMT